MKKCTFKATLTIVLLFAAMLCSFPVNAEGGTYTVSFPVKVSNPKKNIPKDTTFTLVIEGQPHAPLPDPAEITAEVNNTYEFSPIEFTEPGKYIYTVRQLTPEDKKIISDTKVYEIEVSVIRNEDGDLEGGFSLSYMSGNGKPISISFSNDYMKSSNANKDGTSDDDAANSDDAANGDASKQNAPPTGEPLSPAFGGLIISGVLFLFFLVIRKHRMNAEVQPDES